MKAVYEMESLSNKNMMTVHYLTSFNVIIVRSLSSTNLVDQETIEDRQAVLNQYLQDTNILPVFNSWVVLLAGLDELPYNPYPTLVWYARRHAER